MHREGNRAYIFNNIESLIEFDEHSRTTPSCVSSRIGSPERMPKIGLQYSNDSCVMVLF